MGSASMPMRCTGRWCPGNHASGNSGGGGAMASPAHHLGVSSFSSSARTSARRSAERSSGARYYDGSARQILQGSPRRSVDGNRWS